MNRIQAHVSEHEQHVKDWYAKLCAVLRVSQVLQPDIPCIHCERPRKDHLDNDLRCTLYVTSSTYRGANQEAVEQLEKVILSLEQLAAACGWKLP
jgi:hypothetical protein